MDFGQYVTLMEKRAREVPEAMREATKRATDVLHESSRKHLTTDIYDKAPDTTMASRSKSGKLYTNVEGPGGKKRRVRVERVGRQLAAFGVGDDETLAGGKPKWKRTGNLRRSEKRQYLSAYQGAVDNSAEYALPRHNLGFGPGSLEAIAPKPKNAKNTERRAPWRTDAIADTGQARFDIYRAALAGIIGLQR